LGRTCTLSAHVLPRANDPMPNIRIPKGFINSSIFLLSVIMSLGIVSFRVRSPQINIKYSTLGLLKEAKVVIPGIPHNISIPKIDVNTKVELVGLDESYNMGVPKDVDNVGWYRLGHKPGENGNAVIDGHFDSQTGPAIFYKLSELILGDKIIVKDDKGKNFIFSVIDKKSYPYNKLPLKDIFGSQSNPQLVLITCSGQFNRSTQNYSDRTVVYAILTDVN